MTTQPPALRENREEEEIRINQTSKISKKAKVCVFISDDSNLRNNRDQRNRG